MNKLAIAAVLLPITLLVAGLGQVSQKVNKQASPSPVLSDWKGLTCTVYLRVDSNPRAGLTSYESGTTAAGLHIVAGLPTSSVGVLVDVTSDAIVINGGNGYVWIPRDQIRCVEAAQNAASK
jgi:hypothetical protein